MRLLKVRGIRVADERAQARPTRESVLPSDGQLTVAQGERRGFDRVVRSSGVTWVELSYSLARLERAGSLFGQQLLRLMLKLIEVRTRR
jgi:hypothetical protein